MEAIIRSSLYQLWYYHHDKMLMQIISILFLHRQQQQLLRYFRSPSFYFSNQILLYLWSKRCIFTQISCSHNDFACVILQLPVDSIRLGVYLFAHFFFINHSVWRVQWDNYSKKRRHFQEKWQSKITKEQLWRRISVAEHIVFVYFSAYQIIFAWALHFFSPITLVILWCRRRQWNLLILWFPVTFIDISICFDKLIIEPSGQMCLPTQSPHH